MKSLFSKSSEQIEDYKRLHISAKIASYEVKNEETLLGDKYVIYSVNIYSYYKNWTVYKRYSDFEAIHKILQSRITHVQLAEFPPKRFFKNSESTIQERKTKLEDYLNFLFKNVSICSYSEILDFIEIDKELILLLMKNNTMIESKTTVAVKRYNSMKYNLMESSVKKARSVDNLNLIMNENYYSAFLDFKLQENNITNEKSANMLVVEEFLRNLELKFENKCNIIKTFEQFLKSKKSWPSFKREEINKLLFGETLNNSSRISTSSLASDSSTNSRTLLKGLLYHIGNIEQNVLGAETCLDFLTKLIDYEYNPDCEAYIYILKTAKVEALHSMRLSQHIRNNKFSIVNFAFRVIKAIVSEDKMLVNRLKKLINDEDVAEKFIKWLDTHQDV